MAWNDGIYDGLGQDVAAMVEARNAAEWEELNEEPVLDKEEIFYDLTDALDDLLQCLKSIGEAAKVADGFQERHELLSLFDDGETYQTEVENMIAKFKKEVRSA